MSLFSLEDNYSIFSIEDNNSLFSIEDDNSLLRLEENNSSFRNEDYNDDQQLPKLYKERQEHMLREFLIKTKVTNTDISNLTYSNDLKNFLSFC